MYILLYSTGVIFSRKDKEKKYPSMFDVPPPQDLVINDDALTIFTGPAFLGLSYKFLKEVFKCTDVVIFNMNKIVSSTVNTLFILS